MTDGWGISCKIAHRWMPLDFTDDKSTLVQVVAWCRQATSHYLNQCWPRSPTPYGITRPNELTCMALKHNISPIIMARWQQKHMQIMVPGGDKRYFTLYTDIRLMLYGGNLSCVYYIYDGNPSHIYIYIYIHTYPQWIYGNLLHSACPSVIPHVYSALLSNAGIISMG